MRYKNLHFTYLLTYLLSPAVVENPTTSPKSWWGLVEVNWPSTMPRCRRDAQWDVGRQPQLLM